jgi:hypothetical protein
MKFRFGKKKKGKKKPLGLLHYLHEKLTKHIVRRHKNGERS